MQPQGREWCMSRSDPHLRMLEDMLIAKMAQMHRARMSEAQVCVPSTAAYPMHAHACIIRSLGLTIRRAMLCGVQREVMDRMERSEHYLKAAAEMEHCLADPRVKQVLTVLTFLATGFQYNSGAGLCSL